MPKILGLNGPNLNLLGQREPEIYGSETLEDVMSHIAGLANSLGSEFDHYQTNSEASLIDRIHQAGTDGVEFILINPGLSLTQVSVCATRCSV